MDSLRTAKVKVIRKWLEEHYRIYELPTYGWLIAKHADNLMNRLEEVEVTQAERHHESVLESYEGICHD